MQKIYNSLSIKLLIFALPLFIIAMNSGCSSKRYMNKALEMEEAGLINEAADLYLRSVKANNKNVDAKIGLKRTSQVVLDNNLEKFMSHYRNDQYREAVYTFRDARRYRSTLRSLGIEPEFPEEKITYYNEAKDAYLDQQYGKALKFLEAEDFSSAEEVFAEILDLEPTYRDARDRHTTARFEPVYRQALSDMESQKYRSAFHAFDQILEETSGYKAAGEKRDEARKKALITIGVKPFSGSNLARRNVAKSLCSRTISQITSLKSPFYEVTDSPFLKQPDETPIYQRGQSIKKESGHSLLPSNLDALLTGNVSDHRAYTTSLKKKRRKAWLKEETVTENENGEKEKNTDYKKVYYHEYSQESEVLLRVNFILTDIATGRVLVSDEAECHREDKIRYASFDGDPDKLVPGSWESGSKDSDADQIIDNDKAVREFRSMFSANKEVINHEKLKDETIEEMSSVIAKKIVAYNPEI
ncbi:MAG: hypothetical protein R6U46_15040 [Marinilabilia sp.]